MTGLLDGFPLAESALERFKATARKRMQTEQMGAHLRRRRGQSLEYLEHRLYETGDDVRHIDWRASARLPGEDAFLIRAYAAEDRVTLLVSVDDGPTMRRGKTPKLKMAAWLAYAIGRAASRPGDRVYLHRLFGAARPASEIRPRSARAQLAAGLDRLMDAPAPEEGALRLNDQSIIKLLRPTVVWLIVTDLYFDEEAGDRLAQLLRRAQRLNCWVLIVDIDAWPLERRALLDAQAVEISAPRQHRFTFREKDALRIDVDIQKHKNAFIEKARGGSLELSCWTWRPGQTEGGFFKERFEHDDTLRRFFRSK